MDNFICRFCDKLCKNDNSHRNHERLCPKNPNRVYVSYTKGKPAWNKGKTKNDDERLKKSGETLSRRYNSGVIVNHNKGKHLTEEQKQLISKSRKQYLKEHPDKIPFLLNHHSKGDSYPEKYFKDILIKQNIDFKQNYYSNGYFLDFAIPEKKIYFEVDGEQHYNGIELKERDIIRNKKLEDNGWKLIKRVRWSSFQKLNEIERNDFINELLQYFY